MAHSLAGGGVGGTRSTNTPSPLVFFPPISTKRNEMRSK